MKKIFLVLSLMAVCASYSVAQQNALPGKYAGSNTVTLFDSTGVYMEESGLSHVLTHKCIRMYSYAGCARWSTYKIDYDPLSAYCEITHVFTYMLLEQSSKEYLEIYKERVLSDMWEIGITKEQFENAKKAFQIIDDYKEKYDYINFGYKVKLYPAIEQLGFEITPGFDH